MVTTLSDNQIKTDFLKAIKEAREHKGHQELEKTFKAKLYTVTLINIIVRV